MKTKKNGNILIISIILIMLSTFYTLVFLHNTHSLSTTGDLAFHLTRIKSLETILTSPINLNTFSQSGQGVNLFYPYLTLLPATLLFHFTHDLIISYILYVWLVTLLTLFISYLCGVHFFKTNYGALFFSIFYTFSAYRATDFFYRTALAEGVALSFLPIVFLGTYYILTRRSNHWWILSIGLSSIVYTHILSAVICLILILLTLIIKLTIDCTNVKLIIIDFIKSAILTILITTGFWLPMLEQTYFQNINRPATNVLANKALFLGSLLTESLNNNLAYYGCGLLGLAGIMAPLLIKDKLNIIQKIIWILSLISLLITTNLFPWSLLQNTPLNIVQFPWRFMGIQSLFYSISLASIFDKEFDIKSKAIISTICILTISTITCASSINLRQNLLHNPLASTINNSNMDYITIKRFSYYSSDYIPKNATASQEQIINHLLATDQHWQKRDYRINATSFTTKLNTNRKLVTIPLYDYKGAIVIVNGKITKTINNSGLISFNTTTNSNKIYITYKHTSLALLSMVISFSTIIILVISRLYFYRKTVSRRV